MNLILKTKSPSITERNAPRRSLHPQTHPQTEWMGTQGRSGRWRGTLRHMTRPYRPNPPTPAFGQGWRCGRERGTLQSTTRRDAASGYATGHRAPQKLPRTFRRHSTWRWTTRIAWRTTSARARSLLHSEWMSATVKLFPDKIDILLDTLIRNIVFIVIQINNLSGWPKQYFGYNSFTSQPVYRSVFSCQPKHRLLPVLLLSKSNKMFFRYFDPQIICIKYWK